MNLIAAPIRRAVRTGLGALVDLVLPQICCACGGAEVAADGLCAACSRSMLSLVSLPYCGRCGATLGPHVPARDDGCWVCPTVLPRFSRVVRLGPYTHPLREMIHQLKYARGHALPGRLGELLAQAVATQCGPDTLDLAVAVPMHWRRRLGRGYNHAGLLARGVARALRLSLTDGLVRMRHTPPQTTLSRTRRQQNLRGAFAAARHVGLKGATVLLVDDVTTTGATGDEAARTLLAGGAQRVIFAVVAKTEPPTAYHRDWLAQPQATRGDAEA